MLVVRPRRAGGNAGSGHNSTVRPRPPKTTSPPLVRRPAGGTTSGPVASSAREQESWLGAVRTAVDQAHLRSDAVAGLNTLADSLASYADWHGPAVARPPWAASTATCASTSRSARHAYAVPAGCGRCDLAVAQADRPRRPGPRPGDISGDTLHGRHYLAQPLPVREKQSARLGEKLCPQDCSASDSPHYWADPRVAAWVPNRRW